MACTIGRWPHCYPALLCLLSVTSGPPSPICHYPQAGFKCHLVELGMSSQALGPSHPGWWQYFPTQAPIAACLPPLHSPMVLSLWASQLFRWPGVYLPQLPQFQLVAHTCLNPCSCFPLSITLTMLGAGYLILTLSL